jgi:predicted metal-binding membrane protein
VNSEPSARPAHATDRATACLLGLGISIAWVIVVVAPRGMAEGPASFLAAWTVMMTAMMLPSAAPLVLLYRRGAPPVATATLVTGYILVWAGTGIPAYFAHELLPMGAAPIALGAAGFYQLSPLKTSCLRRCRGPADFLMQRWGRGALRLGVEHGLWCVGCCWALMLVLVLAGSMGLVWVVGIAAVVAVEKLTRHGVAWSRLTGIALLCAAFLQGIVSWTGN